jgi:fermentation-respiration switch protein FrsA (DUF1100 family)
MEKTVWIIIVLFVIILFSLLNFLMSIHPIKLGHKRVPSELNLEYENVSFKTSDNLILRGWFIPSNYSDAVIIVGHGYPFSKSNILLFSSFLQEHYNLLLFDFRYFGESEGSYTTVGLKEQEDFKAAINYLKTRNDINSSKIGSIGFSLSASTMLMTKSDVKAIVADSPYATLDRMLIQTYRIFPGFTKMPFVLVNRLLAYLVFGINTKEIGPEKTIKDLNIPVLLIHGEKDSQIPFENSQVIYEASNKSITELWIIEGADHGFGHYLYPEEYESKVLEFFDKHLGVK